MIWRKLEKCRIWHWTVRKKKKEWVGSLYWGPTTIGVKLVLRKDGRIGLTLIPRGDSLSETRWIERAKYMGAHWDLRDLLSVALNKEVLID